MTIRPQKPSLTANPAGPDAAVNIPFSVPPTVPPSVPEGADLDHPGLYFNQELSWLDFNWRVLHLALDERTPLLERVRFLAIAAANLDEFFQKRVGGLKRQEAAGVQHLSPDGRTPTGQLALIRQAALVMHQTITQTWESKLKPALAQQAGIFIYNYAELNRQQQAYCYDYFQTNIYPILTPLAVDPAHPFPFISNLSLSLAIILQAPEQETARFARLKVPTNLERWLPLMPEPERNAVCLLPVEQLIAQHIGALFPGMVINGVYAFRVTRNADIQFDEEEASDLLAMISAELRERRFAHVVRLEVVKTMPMSVRELLMHELDLQPRDVYEVDGAIDLAACAQLADLNLPQLKFKPWEPVVPGMLQGAEPGTAPDIFAVIRQTDVLVHHPYDSFAASVQRLIEAAAVDKHVLAIKQTLYRTSQQSPIVKALIKAAENGKQVAVLVEVKARFDEANNIAWGRMLEQAGVHVTYGVVGLKTHAKVALIVRQEGQTLRTYCHLSTGNYHSGTVRHYTDLGLLTCNPALGHDVVNLFHYLTGYAPQQSYQKVLVAPQDMRRRFYHLIRQEVAFQQDSGNGRIIAKMNALDDVGVIQELYRASQAGVQIDLIIRGHSRLRPGLKGYSDNIRLISILGRFLEHDRIFYFHNNGRPLLFIGSADWRARNLTERVELVTPVEDALLQKRLIDMLEMALSDNCLAWDLDAQGHYTQRRPSDTETPRNFHQMLMEQTLARAENVRP